VASNAYQMTTFFDRAFSTENPIVTPLEEELVGASTADAQTCELDLGDFSRTFVEMFCTSTVGIDYIVESSPDNEHWWNVQTFAAVTTAHSGYENVARYFRVRTSAGAAGTVSIRLVAIR